MNADESFTYDDYARWKMRIRHITEAQVEVVMMTYHTKYPAEPLPHTTRRATVYVGFVDGRDLKVYVEEGRHPPNVLTVVWKGEEQ